MKRYEATRETIDALTARMFGPDVTFAALTPAERAVVQARLTPQQAQFTGRVYAFGPGWPLIREVA